MDRPTPRTLSRNASGISNFNENALVGLNLAEPHLSDWLGNLRLRDRYDHAARRGQRSFAYGCSRIWSCSAWRSYMVHYSRRAAVAPACRRNAYPSIGVILRGSIVLVSSPVTRAVGRPRSADLCVERAPRVHPVRDGFHSGYRSRPPAMTVRIKEMRVRLFQVFLIARTR